MDNILLIILLCSGLYGYYLLLYCAKPRLRPKVGLETWETHNSRPTWVSWVSRQNSVVQAHCCHQCKYFNCKMNAFESSGDLPAASEAVQFKFEPRCTGDGDLCHCEETRSGKRKKLWNTRKKQFSKEDINENNGAICALCGAMHCGERLQAIRLLRAIDANYHCTMGNKRPGKRICHRWAPANEVSCVFSGMQCWLHHT